MNRIFFRFFVLVMLSITAATFVIYFAFARLFGDPLDDIARRQAAAQIFLLEGYVDQAPGDEWLTRLNNVREVSEVRYDLMPLAQALDALGAGQREELERGHIVIDVAGKSLYRRVDLDGERYIGSQDEVLHARDLPIDIGQALKMELLRYVIVAIALLLPIALWSRSHWQGLQSLSQMADEFGAGKLSVRAHLKPSDAVYPLAERINHMAGRIEDLMESQRSLLHSVSHELRTPIARLEFALELLDAKARDPELSRRIAAMEGDLSELNNLVKELLDMSKLDSARTLQGAPVELDDLLRDCCATLPPSPQEVACELAAGLGTMEVDARLLARAVGNLLRNAQKYAQGRIVLSARRTPDGVEIAVDDDGPGIPLDERDRIFDPFYRLDRSRDRATGGFGLGLSIAQKAVVLHGGTLHVEGSPLGGARFVIGLPA
ncbi:ATP-binding protein [Massilia arenae]|uniref:histidine kinase n=1 Tax=Massilia arenae TaxID=2603288 RepID=A0A5C7FY84_9BURK|nr:ATP-binding protein [Massilia arenae]TXG01292.1 two-component sensor histidine kinase [Massilia arenae]